MIKLTNERDLQNSLIFTMVQSQQMATRAIDQQRMTKSICYLFLRISNNLESEEKMSILAKQRFWEEGKTQFLRKFAFQFFKEEKTGL